MKLIYNAVMSLCLLFCLSCSNPDNDLTETERILKANSDWPIELKGVFSIVDAGGYDGDYPTWATGFLEINGEDDYIMIDIDGNAVKDARIEIDSGEPYLVLLDRQTEMYGGLTFKVLKISEVK